MLASYISLLRSIRIASALHLFLNEEIPKTVHRDIPGRSENTKSEMKEDGEPHNYVESNVSILEKTFFKEEEISV